jgi:hypothetical protein
MRSALAHATRPTAVATKRIGSSFWLLCTSHQVRMVRPAGTQEHTVWQKDLL